MSRLLDWLFPTQRLVAHMEQEVAFWRGQFVLERQRCDRLQDDLLAVRVGTPPISQPRGPMAELPKDVAEALRMPDWSQIGSLAGVEDEMPAHREGK